MHFKIVDSQFIITHGMDKVVFDLTTYDKNTYQRAGDPLFKEMNLFVERLSDEHRNSLFHLYADAKEVLESVWDVNELIDNLTDITSSILLLIKYEDVLHFTKGIILSKIITIPVIDKTLGPNERYDLTYIESDYIELLAYGVCMRFLFPIWDNYMASVRGDSDNLYKEYYAFGLCKHSEYNDLPPFHKLMGYIHFYLDPVFRGSKMVTFNGMSSLDLYNLVISMTIVRKLSLTVLDSTDSPSPIIAQLCSFIKLTPTTINREINGKVKHTSGAGDDDDGEGNDSVLDKLRSREKIAPGMIRFEELTTRDPVIGAQSIYPKVPKSTVIAFQKAMDKNINFSKTDAQYILTQIVIDKGIGSSILNLLKWDQYKNAVIIAQSIIYELGYPDIAIMMSAQKQVTEAPVINGGYVRIPKELLSKLYEIYPCFKGDGRIAEEKRKSNEALDLEIESILNDFVGAVWVPSPPTLYLYEDLRPTITAPLNMRVQIAEFLCSFDKHVD